MKIRRQRNRALLIGGIHHPVKPFSSVISYRKQPDIINHDDARGQDLGNRLADRVFQPVRAHQDPQLLQIQPRHLASFFHRLKAQGLKEERLASARRAAEQQVLLVKHPFQGAQRLLGRQRDR